MNLKEGYGQDGLDSHRRRHAIATDLRLRPSYARKAVRVKSGTKNVILEEVRM
jgi:hypothetical protein